jgi:hypothetical protein
VVAATGEHQEVEREVLLLAALATECFLLATYGGGGGGSPLRAGAVSYVNDLVQPRPQRDRVM